MPRPTCQQQRASVRLESSHHNAPSSSRCSLPTLVALLLLALLLVAPATTAHELEIDQVSLWPDPETRGLRGQVSLDPELTRRLPSLLPRREAERRLIAFLEANLELSLDSTRCELEFQVRELYTKGGAVPGDIVLLSCQHLPRRMLEMRVGRGFETLAITVAGFGSPPTRQSVLVRGGHVSPAYDVIAPDDTSWQRGGHENLLKQRSSTSTPEAGSRTPGFESAAPGLRFAEWIRLGFVHILPRGWDHVLFVTALTLGAWRRVARLLVELTTFTVAHCCTLFLGALNWLLVPAAIVEPLIAASIAAMAAHNLLRPGGGRYRIALVFVFGLLHGQGFAGVLSQLNVRQDDLLPSLLGFNLGVEAGQLTVALLVLGLLHVMRRQHRQRWLVLPASLTSIAIATYWILERCLG